MARLDAEAQAAVVRPSRIPTAAEARAYPESLPDLWAKTSDAGRKAMPKPCSSGDCPSPTTPPNGTTGERATTHDGQVSRSLVKSLSSISHAWSRVW
jgi:hypothetical protein